MDIIRTFFPKFGYFFQFSKNYWGGIMCFLMSLAILCLQKRYCYSAFLYWDISFVEDLIHLRFSLVQQLLSLLSKTRSRQYLIISSGKSVLLLKLSRACPQEKSSHKKNHAYLTDSKYFTCLLKKRSREAHVTE